MKPLHFAPPVIALAICAILLGSQRTSIKALEREHGLLLAEIATARQTSTPGRDQTSGKAGKTRSNDWRKIVAALGDSEVRDQIPDILDMRRLEQLILEMDEAEMTAARGEIDSFNLPDSSRRELHRLLLNALSDKNPQLVCQQFIEKAIGQSATLTWPIKQAFEAWLKNDSAAANTWLDQQLAAGTLEGKSLDGKEPIRLYLQAASLYSLIASDPAAAARRMNEIPLDQRKEMLLGSHYLVAENDRS